MSETLKKLLPYALVLVSFSIVLIIVVMLIDGIILPNMIKERETVKMPELIGVNIEEAKKILADRGLQITKIDYQHSITQKEDNIINQTPNPNQMIKVDRNITLIVSKGEEKVKMPYLVGQPLRIAKVELMNKGLKAGKTSYEFSTLYGNDTIVEQSMKPESMIPYGSVIDFVISKGSENQVKVPQLINTPLEEAKEILAESGLTIGEISITINETFLPNTVINQQPVAGELVEEGAAINLTISK
jgi:eukaryotic-like serine/threonine-protein kinase